MRWRGVLHAAKKAPDKAIKGAVARTQSVTGENSGRHGTIRGGEVSNGAAARRRSSREPQNLAQAALKKSGASPGASKGPQSYRRRNDEARAEMKRTPVADSQRKVPDAAVEAAAEGPAGSGAPLRAGEATEISDKVAGVMSAEAVAAKFDPLASVAYFNEEENKTDSLRAEREHAVDPLQPWEGDDYDAMMGQTKVLDHEDGSFRTANLKALMGALLGERDGKRMRFVKKSALHIFLNDITALKRNEQGVAVGFGRNVDTIDWLMCKLPKRCFHTNDIVSACGGIPSPALMAEIITRKKRQGWTDEILYSGLILSFASRAELHSAVAVYESRKCSNHPQLHAAMGKAYIMNNRTDDFWKMVDGLREDVTSGVVLGELLVELVARRDDEKVLRIIETFALRGLPLPRRNARAGLIWAAHRGDLEQVHKVYGLVDRPLNPAVRGSFFVIDYTYAKALVYLGKLEQAMEIWERLEIEADGRNRSLLKKIHVARANQWPENFANVFPEAQRLFESATYAVTTTDGVVGKMGVGPNKVFKHAFTFYPENSPQSTDAFNDELAYIVESASGRVVREEALAAYERMEQAHILPDGRTFEILLKAFDSNTDLVGARSLFDEMEAKNIQPPLSFCVAFFRVAMQPKYHSGQDNIRQLAFRKLSERQVALSAQDYVSMMSACQQASNLDIATKVAKLALANGVRPPKKLVAELLEIGIRSGDMFASRAIFEQWREHGAEFDEEMLDEKVRLLAVHGDLAGAIHALADAGQSNALDLQLSTYEALVDCYMSYGGTQERLPLENPYRGDEGVHATVCQNFLLAVHLRHAEQGGARQREVLQRFGESLKEDGISGAYRLKWRAAQGLDVSEVTDVKGGLGSLPNGASALAAQMEVNRVAGDPQRSLKLYSQGVGGDSMPKADFFVEAILASIQAGEGERVSGILDRMTTLKIRPSRDEYSKLVRALADANLGNAVDDVLADARDKKGLVLGEAAYGALASFYKRDQRDVRAAFLMCVEDGVVPTEQTLLCLEDSFKRGGDKAGFRAYLTKLHETVGCPDYSLLHQALVSRKGQDMLEAINAHVRFGDAAGIEYMIREFPSRYVGGPEGSYAVEAKILAGELDDAAKLLEEGAIRSEALYEKLIFAYAKRNELDRVLTTARYMAREGIHRSVDVYNACIGCLLMRNHFEEAMAAAEELTCADVRPNAVTVRLCEVANSAVSTPAHMDLLMRLKYQLEDDRKALA